VYSDPLSRFKTAAGDAGVPMGEPALKPDGSVNPTAADNARTIRETKAIVANYRVRPTLTIATRCVRRVRQ
jgi:hypothetical protein